MKNVIPRQFLRQFYASPVTYCRKLFRKGGEKVKGVSVYSGQNYEKTPPNGQDYFKIQIVNTL